MLEITINFIVNLKRKYRKNDNQNTKKESDKKKLLGNVNCQLPMLQTSATRNQR
jgi:hypothetical protein